MKLLSTLILTILLAVATLGIGCRENVGPCTSTLSPGANLNTAISGAAPNAVICLNSGNYNTAINLGAISRSTFVTVQNAPGATPVITNDVTLSRVERIRFQGLKFTQGVAVFGPSSGIRFYENEITGNIGLLFIGGDHSVPGQTVNNVIIVSNNIHDINYTGSQGTQGDGIGAWDGVSNFTIIDNTIKSTASDYIQTAGPQHFNIQRNTFLGPSLCGSRCPGTDHQDLLQAFGSTRDFWFKNNVARNTGTSDVLLIQQCCTSSDGTYHQDVRVVNNLFDHAGGGGAIQITNTGNFTFTDNTIVGGDRAILLRAQTSGSPAGTNYDIERNVITNIGNSGYGCLAQDGAVGGWTHTYNQNVCGSGSIPGTNSISNWTPAFVNTVNYEPVGLPFKAGYRVP